MENVKIYKRSCKLFFPSFSHLTHKTHIMENSWTSQSVSILWTHEKFSFSILEIKTFPLSQPPISRLSEMWDRANKKINIDERWKRKKKKIRKYKVLFAVYRKKNWDTWPKIFPTDVNVYKKNKNIDKKVWKYFLKWSILDWIHPPTMDNKRKFIFSPISKQNKMH